MFVSHNLRLAFPTTKDSANIRLVSLSNDEFEIIAKTNDKYSLSDPSISIQDESSNKTAEIKKKLFHNIET